MLAGTLSAEKGADISWSVDEFPKRLHSLLYVVPVMYRNYTQDHIIFFAIMSRPHHGAPAVRAKVSVDRSRLSCMTTTFMHAYIAFYNWHGQSKLLLLSTETKRFTTSTFSSN